MRRARDEGDKGSGSQTDAERFYTDHRGECQTLVDTDERLRAKPGQSGKTKNRKQLYESKQP